MLHPLLVSSTLQTNTEGIINATGKSLPVANPPSFGHICKRINRLSIDIKRDTANDDDIIVSIDSTGIELTNRGQWMSDNWYKQNKKRLSQDSCCGGYKDKINPCSGGNR
ncbi:hypothetical protein BH23THE1_BH23THE1_36540 [soil metagenome]